MADRKYFIEGSVVSSRALLAKVSKQCSSSSRGNRFLMEFHQDWRHETCPVMNWYRIQQVSSTTFRSIQHRKDSNPPFFHEFLLLQLDDGSVCRVERAGHSSMEAILNAGCVANDCIQYFSSISYKAYSLSNPSELISEVHFPCDLDIMDVLAVCYAISSWPRTRTYTLQRFNCYFFCSTILLALSRRFLSWDAAVTLDTWKSALNQALDQLAQASQTPASEHLVFRICRLLEPNNPNPVECFLEAFRDRLGGAPDAYNSLKCTLSKTLWRSSWAVRMNRSITSHVNAAVATALDRNVNCARVLKSAIHDSRDMLREKYETFDVVNDIFKKKATAAVCDNMHLITQASDERYRLEKIENPRSVFRYAWIHLAASALGIWFPIQIFMAGDMQEWGFKGNNIFLQKKVLV